MPQYVVFRQELYPHTVHRFTKDTTPWFTLAGLSEPLLGEIPNVKENLNENRIP